MSLRDVIRAPLLFLVLTAACGAERGEPAAAAASAVVYDCNAPTQRLTCPAPSDPDRHFICHGTASGTQPYVKISVPTRNTAHAPGVAHGGGRPDQAPGASAADVGSGAGLDCDCNPRHCNDVCDGAPDGAECDDGDRCTGNGTCLGGACQAGPARCTAGAAVDACNVQTGTCDGATGACVIAPAPDGTPCDDGAVCTANDVCTAGTCGGAASTSSQQTTFAWQVSLDGGASWFPVTLPNTNFGCSFCTRLYRTFVEGVPCSVSFRFGSDNEAGMFVNGQPAFTDYYDGHHGQDWCTASACCSQCCDTFSNCNAVVSGQTPFTLSSAALAHFVPGTNEIRWVVHQQSGGSGFHTLMTVSR